jgi:hypothetical protein
MGRSFCLESWVFGGMSRLLFSKYLVVTGDVQVVALLISIQKSQLCLMPGLLLRSLFDIF